MTTPVLTPADRAALDALAAGPCAWTFHRRLGPHKRRMPRLERIGWVERWEHPKGLAWTFTPWGAAELGKVVRERPVPARRKVRMLGQRMPCGGICHYQWDADGRVVRNGLGDLTPVYRDGYETTVREVPRWADDAEEEVPVRVVKPLGEVSLDWIPEPRAPMVEDEQGEEAEAFTIEGRPVELFGVALPRGRAVRATRATATAQKARAS